MIKRGFTIIELLVVIALLGLSATIVIAGISNSTKEARNKRRITEVLQLNKALEYYRLDHNERYPAPNARGTDDIQILSGFLVPEYIKSIPNDPSNDPNNYGYGWDRDGAFYAVYVPFGNDGGVDCIFAYPPEVAGDTRLFRVPKCHQFPFK